MRPAPFRYECAPDVDSALAALASGGTVLAGGQTLLPDLKRRLVRPRLLVDINRIPALAMLAEAADGFAIGSLVRHQEIADSLALRGATAALPEAAGRIADVQVRGRGTVGGNLCSGNPRANLSVALLALGGTATIAGPEGERRVELDEFFAEPGATAVGDGELLVRIATPATGVAASCYEEAAVQPNGVPIVNVAAAALADGRQRVAIGGLAGVPWRPTRLEGSAGPLSERADLAAMLTDELADRPRFEDMHGDASYRLSLASVLVGRCLGRLAAADRPTEGSS